MTNIQDEKDRIDAEAIVKKDEADRQATADRQTAADQESARIRQEAEQKAQEIQNNAQN